LVFAVGLAQAGEGELLAGRLAAACDANNAQARIAGRPWELAFSVGVAETKPGDDMDALLARADAALYAKKLTRR
jgi:PleD family two-component response regulator